MKTDYIRRAITRRQLLGHAGLAGAALATSPAWAQVMTRLPLPGGPQERPIATDFPHKGAMIL
jgi:hypothetical protein